MKLEKLFAMNVAASLTESVLGMVTPTLPVDGEIKDAGVRTANLMAWETFRIFHAAVTKALDDEEHWPSPKATLDFSGALSETANALLPMLPGAGPVVAALAPIVKDLLSQIGTKPSAPSKPPTTPIPNPGV